MAKKDKAPKIMTSEQMKEFIKENNIQTVEDIQSVLKNLFAETLQGMLEGELDTQLGYTKHDEARKTTDNRRNGHSSKSVRSDYGEVELEVPRDRKGEFEPVIVKKNQRNVTGIEEQIIALYSKGISTRDIQSHLEQLYGIEVSPTLISNVTNKIMPTIKEWQSRPLQKTYAIVFLDAIHYKVKQEGMIVNKASYMVIGIDMDGRKDVLGIWIGENETAKFWLVVLNELKNRGVEDILIISVDNLKGFNEAIQACYPKTEIQKCIVHQIRNSVRFVNYKDLKKVTSALKPIYSAASEQAGLEALEEFNQAWGGNIL
jgi:transposase-like protein